LHYCDPRTEAIHVFVCRAHLDVRTLDRALAPLEVDRFGLAAYAINPLNALAALSRSDRHMRVFLDPGLSTETFLTNNLGSRTISCAVSSGLYMGAVDTILREFDPQRLHYVEDRDSFFNLHQQRLLQAGDHGRDLRGLPGVNDDPPGSERPCKAEVPAPSLGFEFTMKRLPRGTDSGCDLRFGVRHIADILSTQADRSPCPPPALARDRRAPDRKSLRSMLACKKSEY
jgi:hypothetical protein